jgi:hypothetical protein
VVIHNCAETVWHWHLLWCLLKGVGTSAASKA